MSQRRFACLIAVLFLALSHVQAGTLAQFRTVFGDIEVELYDQDKPVTVQNFIRYLQSGRYTNGISHRLFLQNGGGIRVLQGGGFTLYTNNISFVPTYPPITNEFKVGKFYSNVYGTIAMAKTSDPNSATSQYFFNLIDNSTSLDDTNNSGGFTVFGHVIAGTNVLNIYNSFQNFSGTQQNNIVTNLSGYFGPNFASCPLLHTNIVASNFVFIDITLLQVDVQPVTGGRQISWNSAVGMTNIVEFTTNMPPAWTVLVSTNGTGSRMTVQDNAADPRRFYRVRVAY